MSRSRSAAWHRSPARASAMLPPQLEALAEAQARVCLGVEPRRRGKLPLRSIDVLIADPEPTFSVVVAVPRFLEDFVGQTRTGRTFNRALSAVDGAGDLPTALESLHEAEAAITQSFATKPSAR